MFPSHSSIIPADRMRTTLERAGPSAFEVYSPSSKATRSLSHTYPMIRRWTLWDGGAESFCGTMASGACVRFPHINPLISPDTVLGPLCTEQEEDASKSPLSPEQRAQDEKVKRFQKKLNDYLLSVVITDKAQVAGFMKKVKNIQNCMFPNGTWPPNLWPAADIESKLKEAEAGRSLPQEEFIRRFRRNYPGAEKFPVTIAHEDHSLIDKVETLLMYMEEFVAATGGQMKEWEGCPLDLEAFNLVYRGYLRWMCWEADRAYGSDTGFVARCKKRLEEHEALVGKGTDGPGSSEAGGDFMRHQRTLLSWCKIPGDVVFPCSWVLNDTR